MSETNADSRETRKRPTAKQVVAGLAATAATAAALSSCAETTAGPRTKWTTLEMSVASPLFVGDALSTPVGLDAITQSILDYEHKVRVGAMDEASAESIEARGKVADLAGQLTAAIDAPLFGQDGPAKNALAADFRDTAQIEGKKAGSTYQRVVMSFADSAAATKAWVEVDANRSGQKLTSPNYEEGDTWYHRTTTVDTDDGDRVVSDVSVVTKEGVLMTTKRADVHVTIDSKQYGLTVVGQHGYRHLTGMAPVNEAPKAGVKFYEGVSIEGATPITDEALCGTIFAKAAKTVVAANEALNSPNASFTGVGKVVS